MKEIYTGTGKLIKNIDDWKTFYTKGKENHSAWEFGKFIFEQNGLDKIKNVVEKSLNIKIEFDQVFIEKGVKFDDYQRESQRDMVIQGQTGDGKNVFITIEAKVAETFGDTVKARLVAANKYLQEHKQSKSAERIEKIYTKLLGSRDNIENSELRYQLFHAAASTAHETSNIGIMLIVELLSESVNKRSLQRNKDDFKAFMEALHAIELQNTDYVIYEAKVMDKTIRCIFAEF